MWVGWAQLTPNQSGAASARRLPDRPRASGVPSGSRPSVSTVNEIPTGMPRRGRPARRRSPPDVVIVIAATRSAPAAANALDLRAVVVGRLVRVDRLAGDVAVPRGPITPLIRTSSEVVDLSRSSREELDRRGSPGPARPRRSRAWRPSPGSPARSASRAQAAAGVARRPRRTPRSSRAAPRPASSSTQRERGELGQVDAAVEDQVGLQPAVGDEHRDPRVAAGWFRTAMRPCREATGRPPRLVWRFRAMSTGSDALPQGGRPGGQCRYDTARRSNHPTPRPARHHRGAVFAISGVTPTRRCRRPSPTRRSPSPTTPRTSRATRSTARSRLRQARPSPSTPWRSAAGRPTPNSTVTTRSG